jgi:tetratricopeptide (TPR) repeat protein
VEGDAFSALAARLRRFSETGDPSVVLDPATPDEARRLWDAAILEAGDPRGVSVDVLMVLASVHWFRYQALPKEQDEDDLRMALDFFGILRERAPERVPDQIAALLASPSASAAPLDDSRRFTTAGIEAMNDFQRTGRSEVLEAALSAFRDAVDVTPLDHPNRFGCLSNLGGALFKRFERVGDVGDLDDAIEVGREAVDVTPLDHPKRAGCLSNLGGFLISRFDRVGDVGDLDAAITVGREAVDATPQEHPYHATCLSNLGNSLRVRFERLGDVGDLDAAIQAGREAVDATPIDHRDRTAYLSSLGSALLTRFERVGDVGDLDAAIQVGREAVDATPLDHPGRAGRLSDLGVSLRVRFERFGDAGDLDAAIQVGREAVDATPLDHPGRAGRLSNLGASLRARFERLGDVGDLDAAIQVGREAVDATPLDHPDRAGRLSNRGISLTMRFDRFGDVGDLDAAIQVGREAVDATPLDHPDRAGRLSNLAISLRDRFDRVGDVGDLDAAIQAAREAVDATPLDYPRGAMHLSSLGNSLRTRFDRVGDLGDLDAAITVGRGAVDATPLDHPDRAAYLSNVGAALLARFDRVGDVGDLDAAITVGREAVDATPLDRPDRVLSLSNLGNSLRTRFDRVGDLGDLDEAIQAGREAVDATPADHPNRALYLSNLGNSLRTRFDRVGDLGDLDAAITVGREAVDATPADHPNRAGRLSNFGGSLLARFEQAGNVGDLDAAITVGREAVDATPADHPNRAGRLSNLGSSKLTRFERAGNVADLDAAIVCWQQATRVETGIPSTRLAAGRRWGAAGADADRRKDAAEGFAVAVGLLPVVAWHGLDRATRQEQLAQWAGLASDAAACAVLDGRPGLAVELLEQGRSVLWGQGLNLRTDLTRLKAADPDLAGRLERIRAILDSPVPDPSAPAVELAGETVEGRDRRRQDGLDLRRGLARDWDQVLGEVRKLDGFRYFLAPTPYVELAAAVDGPVVVVNASGYGCQALIVDAGSGQPRVVDLPDLTQDSAIERANKLLAAVAGAGDPHRSFLEGERHRYAVLVVLDWLWDVVGEPVLAALGHTGPPPPGQAWPRVWWCPTGALSMLPIHAAGHHPRHNTWNTSGVSAAGEGRVVSVLDRVVSSYTPTLAALARAREPGTPGPAAQLTVAMPKTPDLSPLPAAAVEAEVLARHFPVGGGNARLVGSDATREAVLAAIATHPWVHLACHAGQAHADPSASGFALWDGPLTLADLASRPTRRRDLAFLSACQTATGGVRHLDEAIHLAAAMQFLGYRHVIATMWTIADPPAPEVADAVYTELNAGGTPSADHTALAVHRAIQALRRKDPTNPILWAPYTHLGA